MTTLAGLPVLPERLSLPAARERLKRALVGVKVRDRVRVRVRIRVRVRLRLRGRVTASLRPARRSASSATAPACSAFAWG